MDLFLYFDLINSQQISSFIVEIFETCFKEKTMSETNRRLYRSQSNCMLAGICGGLGEYLNTDPTVIRLLTVLAFFIWPPTPLAYLVMWLIVPQEPEQTSPPIPPAAG